jgi:hypothetical protein
MCTWLREKDQAGHRAPHWLPGYVVTYFNVLVEM